MKKFFLSLILIISGTPFLIADDDSDREYMRLVERGDSAIKAEDYNAAIDFFTSAMRLQPGNASNILLLSNNGMLHYYLGNDSMAIATLNDAHEMAPNSVTVLQNRAKVLNGTGRFSEALMDYSRIIELDSTLVEPWIQRGLLMLKGGDVRGAEASLAQAEKLEPDSRDIFVSYALLYSRTNRPKEAIPYLNRLIKKEPQSEYYAERAMCLLRLDDLGGAVDDINDGLQLDPDYPDLYVARALLNKRRYREKDAMADAAKAVELGADARPLKALGLIK